jgi:uncharacterized membrane protein
MNKTILIKQCIFIALFLAIGFISQLLLFKTPANTLIQALLFRQWLWIIYFCMAHFMVERLYRTIKAPNK